MAKCEVCGKRFQVGNQVSHSHHATKKKWKPNLHSVKAVTGGTVKRIKVCTKCLRSDKVKKAK